MALSSTVSKIKRDVGRKSQCFHTPPAFRRHVRSPSDIVITFGTGKNRGAVGFSGRVVKTLRILFTDTMHEHDRRTDYTHDGIGRAMHSVAWQNLPSSTAMKPMWRLHSVFHALVGLDASGQGSIRDERGRERVVSAPLWISGSTIVCYRLDKAADAELHVVCDCLWVLFKLTQTLNECETITKYSNNSKMCVWIWMTYCMSTDVGTWTNWLTFEPDPDHSPDPGTIFLPPIPYNAT